jgi:hypothetical protein
MPRRKRKHKGERDFNSTLPVWIIEQGERKGTLNLTCPRCNGRLIVSREKLTNGPSSEFMGRSCVYCFRTNRLPEKYMSSSVKQFLVVAKGEVDD